MARKRKILGYREAKAQFEREYCETVLSAVEGNVTEAALVAGKERTDFYSLMRRCGVDPDRFRREVAA